MPLLIDGYNLLNVTGIIGRGVGPGSLERARRALLNFLAESLDAGEAQRTTVVFDAGDDAPRQLPRRVNHRGIAVHFAARYEDADSMIEELIAADSAPRSLTVVSSDHRIQRAARRRRAKAVDSDRWYQETLRRRAAPTPARETKPATPLSPGEVQHWIDTFSGSEAGGSPSHEKIDDLPGDDIFPPGFGEDIKDA